MGLAVPALRTIHNQLSLLVVPAVDVVYRKRMDEWRRFVRNTMKVSDMHDMINTKPIGKL